MTGASELQISDTLALPVDAVTETFAILAKRGAGKSNAAVVMAEQMHAAGLPWVAIDPKGDWWGIRSSGDGKAAGLPLPVFGGEHGDLPLEPTAGALIADLVVDERLTSVIDVSEFSKNDQRRFLLDFAGRIIRRNRDPLHLFLEEAHEYLPQRVMANDAPLVGAWAKVVKQGRFRGLGCTLITQRSASLNKDVLTQVESLIVMRTTAPQDRAAVKAWVEEHDFAHELLASLPSLESGEAWIWSPEFLGVTERFRFRRRSTFDSGATPKVGAKRQTVATLADVDLGAIKEQMAETIERAQQDDPKALRKRIAQLERELASQPVERVEVEVKLPYIPPALVDGIGDVIAGLHSVTDDLQRHLDAAQVTPDHLPTVPSPTDASAGFAPLKDWRVTAPGVASARRDPAPARAGDGITGGARRMLEALATWPNGLTRSQLGTQAKVKKSGGTFGTYLSRLSNAGLITTAGQDVRITDAGLDYIGGARPPVDPDELRDHWRSKFTGGARRMFDELVLVYPGSLSRHELAEITGIAQTGGTFGTYLSRLRSNDCIEVDGDLVRAHPDLFLGED